MAKKPKTEPERKDPLALTPADIAYPKGIAPADVVDEMIADGEFVINGKKVESASNRDGGIGGLSMSKEKMAELKIKIPARWLDFIDEYYQVTGRNRNEDQVAMVKAEIEMPMLEDKHLSLKDRIRLVEKYQLTDIYKIPQWVRDETAGIPRKVKPATDNPKRDAVRLLIVNNPKFKEAFNRHQKAAEVESFIKALDVVPPEELVALRTAMAAV